MLQIMQVQAPYFFSLAILLLEKAGTKDPFGLSYVDERAEIRGTADGKTVQVRNKGIASNVPDMIVASRGPDGETFEKEHQILAAHLQWKAGRCFEGAHVFVFSLPGPDGFVTEQAVLATDLDDAYRHVGANREASIRDLLMVMTPEQAEASGISLSSVPTTTALKDARELSDLVAEAVDSPDQVYVFTLMPRNEKADSWRGTALPPIRALGLADAEEAVLTMLKGDQRITKVEIETLAEFYQQKGRNKTLRTQMQESAGVARRGSERF